MLWGKEKITSSKSCLYYSVYKKKNPIDVLLIKADLSSCVSSFMYNVKQRFCFKDVLAIQN